MPRTGSSRKAKSADRVTYLPPKEQSTSRPSSAPSLQQVLRAGGEAPEAARPQAWAVGLNRVTLSFSNGALDVEWRRLVALADDKRGEKNAKQKEITALKKAKKEVDPQMLKDLKALDAKVKEALEAAQKARATSNMSLIAAKKRRPRK